ncbi:unnamed protein product [Tuber aestivum]|uniref:Uncharacterized protein n=1 Tax=Tuber aestivum TaxID=59557 RepID=A0A292Q2D0_9PEZI|nr:unnamed protein product [Tuber aestivum]
MDKKGNYLATYAVVTEVASAKRRANSMEHGPATTQFARKPLTLSPPTIPAKDGSRPSVPLQSSPDPAEDIGKLTSSELPPIHCKLSPPPSQTVLPPQPSSPCSPLTQSPTGMNNSQAKTARKSAHISANRGDGHTSSGNVSRRTSVHQGPKSLMDGNGSASPGENNCASSTSESGILARGSVSATRVINPTTQPNIYSPSKELHQSASSSSRQGILSQHARSPSWSPPVPVSGGNVGSTSKTGRRKMATFKAAAIAREPGMNVDGTAKKNPRKHHIDKPEERKAKRNRPEREGMHKFSSNPLGNSNPRSKSSRPPARSNPPSRQPAERNPSFSAPLIPTGVHQSQPGFSQVGQSSGSPATPPKRFVDAISISSSSPMSPAASTDHAANASGGRAIIILSPESSLGAGGLVSEPGSFVECSIRGSELGGRSPSFGSDEGVRGTNCKYGVRGRVPGEPMLTDGLERKLKEILPIANEFYEKNPELGVRFPRQRFDDFLNKKDGAQADARFQFLKKNLRTYTSDKRALNWEEVLTGDFEPNDYQWALTDHLEVWGLHPPTVAIGKRPEEGSPEFPKEKSPREDLDSRTEASLETGEMNASGMSPKDEPIPGQTGVQRVDLCQQPEALPLPAVGLMPFSPVGPIRRWPPENLTRTPTETPRPVSPSPQETPKDAGKQISRLELRDSCIGDQSSSATSTTPPTSQPFGHSARAGRKKLTRPLPSEFAGESQSVVEARSRVLSNGSRQSKNPVFQRISGLRAREHSIWRELSDVAKKVKEKDIEFEKMIENAKVPIGDEMDPDLDSGLEADSVIPLENESQKVSPDWEALWNIHTDQRCFHEKMKQQEMRLVREGSIINVEIKELQKRTGEQAAMVNRVAHHSPQGTESVIGDDDSTLQTKSSSATRSFDDLRDAPTFGGHRSIFGIPMGDSLVEGLKLWSGQSDTLAPVVTSSVAAEASEAARAKKRTRRRRMGW